MLVDLAATVVHVVV